VSASLIPALPPSTLAGPPDGMIAANVPRFGPEDPGPPGMSWHDNQRSIAKRLATVTLSDVYPRLLRHSPLGTSVRAA
jgi:hypothetical protein